MEAVMNTIIFGQDFGYFSLHCNDEITVCRDTRLLVDLNLPLCPYV